MGRKPQDLDADLLPRALAGDARAWSELVAAYSPLVFGTAYRTGLGAEDAADVSQAVWVALLEGGTAIRDPRALPKWLAVTSWRTAVQHRQRERGRAAIPLEDDLASPEPSAEELLDRERRAEEVRKALSRLSGKCRSLLMALFEEDNPGYREVAERLNIPVGSIGPTRARCLARLHEFLEDARRSS